MAAGTMLAWDLRYGGNYKTKFQPPRVARLPQHGDHPAHPGGGQPWRGGAGVRACSAAFLRVRRVDRGDRVRRALPAAGARGAVGGIAVAVAALLRRRRRHGRPGDHWRRVGSCSRPWTGWRRCRPARWPAGSYSAWSRSPSCSSISTCAPGRCRRPSPKPGCRRCRRGSGRISCSTASTRCFRSFVATPSAPKSRWKTWPISFGC